MGILILIAIAIIMFLVFWYKQGTSTNKLRSLLAAGNWKAANKETNRLLALITARVIRGEIALQDPMRNLVKDFGIKSSLQTKLKLSYSHCLSNEEISKIPCQALHEIDQLWVKYSNGHFGFSIQLQILEECKQADEWQKEEIQKFDRKMFTSMQGWYNKDNPWFDLSLADPVEMLIFWDRLGWITRGYNGWGEYGYLLSAISVFELNYSISAPKGYLPVFENWMNMPNIYTINVLQRLKDCGY
jgi:GUN4-like